MQKRVECECGWFQQTDDEATLVAAVQRHAKDVHNMEGVTASKCSPRRGPSKNHSKEQP